MGYEVGMLCIPQECCIPHGVQRRKLTPVRIQSGFAYLGLAAPRWGCRGEVYKFRECELSGKRIASKIECTEEGKRNLGPFLRFLLDQKWDFA
jgi:hypothetical protein